MSASKKPNGKSIVVVQSGFVFLAEATRDDVHNGYQCKNTSVIRNWGTSQGLGQIALTGPTKSTVLDPCGSVFIPLHAVLCVITCTY